MSFEKELIALAKRLTSKINELINKVNDLSDKNDALEKRLADLEGKTDTILMVKEKYNKRCDCPKYGDSNLCPYHDIKQSKNFNSGCAKCGKVLLDGKCLDCK